MSENIRKKMPVKNGFFQSLRRLFDHMSPRRRWQLAVVMALMLLGAISELVSLGAIVPFLALITNPEKASSYPILRDLFSLLGGGTGENIVFPAAGLFCLTVIVTTAIRLTLLWAGQKFAFRFGHDLGVELYRKTLNQPYIYHLSKNTSEFLAGVNKVEQVTAGVLRPMMQFVISGTIATFIITLLISIDVATSLASMSIFALMYVVITLSLRKGLARNGATVAEMQNRRIQTLQEGFGGIRDILINKTQSIYLNDFRQSDLHLRDAQISNLFVSIAPRFLVEALGMFIIVGLTLKLSLEPGGLMNALPFLGALALGAQRLLPILQSVYNSWATIAGNKQSLHDVLDLLDLPEKESPVANARESSAPLPFNSGIELKDICYHYDEKKPLTLRDVNIRIEKGSLVGIVGKTGSGKSTLIDLIMGLLEPSKGSISIDDIELTRANVHQWQQNIAHVPQAIFLADTSIAGNIAFGIIPEKVDHARVREAARMAGAADFIEEMKDGYDTEVGERGVRLSGGQRQRIGIARALYKQASILVFDEATSALDDETEKRVMESINTLSKTLTIIMIAHRLSTLENCDRVVRLSNGTASYAAEL